MRVTSENVKQLTKTKFVSSSYDILEYSTYMIKRSDSSTAHTYSINIDDLTARYNIIIQQHLI